jgi:hypothetical protein
MDTQRHPASITLDQKMKSEVGGSKKRPLSGAAALPLNWTRIKRRPRTTSIAGNNSKAVKKDPKENDASATITQILSITGNGDCECCPMPNYDALLSDLNLMNPHVVEGMAIFCLHDTSVAWFQGYFLPKHDKGVQRQPIGLLAKERSIDECLQCADGGYRELDVTVSISIPRQQQSDNHNKRRKASISAVCTGGEMMRIRTMTMRQNNQQRSRANSNLSGLEFDAAQVLTGRSTVKYMNQYFQGLLQRRQKEMGIDGHSNGSSDNEAIDKGTDAPIRMSSLELLPDCAIVIGTMRMAGKLISTQKAAPRATEPEDGWLSDGEKLPARQFFAK